MKFSEAKRGRTFIIRLEDGDVLHERIEGFAKDQSIKAASLIILGGADSGSMLIVGPEEGRSKNIRPMAQILDKVHEITGTGTIFPDEDDNPVLHMHIACGRKSNSITGCVRKGVKVWHIMEIVLFELVETSAKRVTDDTLGFKLLKP